MLLRIILIGLLGVGAAQAQEAAVTGQNALAEVAKTMPAKRLKALRTAPDGFLDDAAEMIYAFGSDGHIDKAGLEAFITVRRAEIRAQKIRDFVVADLNNDGTISKDEATFYAGTLAARRRDSLQWGFDLADTDADGSVTMAELRAHADGVAMKLMDEIDAAGARSLILFDLDANGAVAMDEVVTAVTALADPQ